MDEAHDTDMEIRPTAKAHEIVRQVVGTGETVVDATAGNGHDSLFLAGLVGSGGRVLAFDIQAAAIESTRNRLRRFGMVDRVELRHESHAQISAHVADGSVAAVMYNLGYLPGADHAVITQCEETLRALAAVPQLLREGGVCTVVCYPGHAGGEREAAAVVAWARGLEGALIGEPARPGAPFLIAWQRGGQLADG